VQGAGADGGPWSDLGTLLRVLYDEGGYECLSGFERVGSFELQGGSRGMVGMSCQCVEAVGSQWGRREGERG
jgi:hypothetical protein